MNSAAHPVKAGFNQSGGAYFMITAPNGLANDATGAAAVTPATLYSPAAGTSHMYRLASAGSNSGGAFVPPTFVVANARDAFGIITTDAAGASGAATEVGQGKLLRDMGKTVVSSGRTFRKFQAVGTGGTATVNYASTFGVQGGAAVAPNAGYASFYLEVGREGAGTGVPAPVARYF